MTNVIDFKNVLAAKKMLDEAQQRQPGKGRTRWDYTDEVQLQQTERLVREEVDRCRT